MTAELIHQGRRLAPGEAVVWQGAPAWRSVLRTIFHLPWIAAYLGFLLGLDAYQAWAKGIPPLQAIHDSVPLAVISGFVLVLLVVLAWMTERTTRYTVTDRRVILTYGLAMSATLSIPFGRITSSRLAIHRDHTGDIPLGLDTADHMPFLKLWPHARPFRLAHPEPMLRCVPQAGVVAGILARLLLAEEQRRVGEQKLSPAEQSNAA